MFCLSDFYSMECHNATCVKKIVSEIRQASPDTLTIVMDYLVCRECKLEECYCWYINSQQQTKEFFSQNEDNEEDEEVFELII